MKRFLHLITLAIVLAFCALLKTPAKASSDLDRIDNFKIKASVRDDATIDFQYYIDWTVLDSDSDGPLSWVKIGIPNQHVDQIKILTSNTIKSAKYYLEGKDTFIRVDFWEDYYRGSTVSFGFSFHQSYMFSQSGENIIIDYTPGWFDEINVIKLTVEWDNTNVLSYSGPGTSVGNTIIFQKDLLSHGGKMNVNLVYSKTTFPNINLEEDTAHLKDPVDWSFVIFLVIVVVIIVIIIIIAYAARDPYYSARGFTDYYPYHYNYYIFRPHPHVHDSHGKPVVDPRVTRAQSSGFHGGHSGGGHCACACACACAGGGRAGCARKDFYHPNLEAKRLIDAIDKRTE